MYPDGLSVTKMIQTISSKSNFYFVTIPMVPFAAPTFKSLFSVNITNV